jgi:hypothetical protein
MIRIVVFVVLMMFWLFAGGYVSYQGDRFNPVGFGSGTLVPWLCVAILGYEIYGGRPRNPLPP